MPTNFDQIRKCVSAGDYTYSMHAAEQSGDRRITLWQVVASIDTATVVSEKPEAQPNPTVVARHVIPSGAVVHAVWSFVRGDHLIRAKLVTIYFPRNAS